MAATLSEPSNFTETLHLNFSKKYYYISENKHTATLPAPSSIMLLAVPVKIKQL